MTTFRRNNDHARPAAETIRASLDVRIVMRHRVVIIGQGGIGRHLVPPLARFLASVCDASAGEQIQLVLCDGDSYAPENAYRMDFATLGNKAEIMGRELIERLGKTSLSIRWIREYVTRDNVARIIQDGDCVLLACDNHATRKLVGQHCASGALSDVVLISGGNDGMEDGKSGTYGNVQVYVRAAGNDITAPLARFHPEIADPADRSPNELNCQELAAAGAPQLAFVNLAVASAMCNALLRLMQRDGRPMYDEVALDIFDARCGPLWLTNVAD